MTKSSNAFEKRVKRHIIAKEKEYFAITAPNMESKVFKELTELSLPIHEIKEEKGGVCFKGKLDGCYLANLNSRLANRILMRLFTFKATNFRQSDKILSEFPFELYLFSDVTLKIQSTSKASRLYHSDAICENFTKSVTKRLKAKGIPKNKAHQQTLFVRILNDQVTLSLDTSGEILYKRGIKTHIAEAPIRETIAAMILQSLKVDPEMILLDPMCGSGTFSLEGAMMAKGLPPGWFRAFSFFNWPAFRPPHWNYLKKSYEQKIRHYQAPIIFASDKSETACQKLKETVKKYALDDIISVSSTDFFDLLPPKQNQRKGAVLINPPYGHRLGDRKESQALYENITKKLRKDFSGWSVAMIIPKHYDTLADFKKRKTKPFFHGGLNLQLIIGII